MRIVVHDYGAYAFTAQLARSLAQRGHEVTYLHSVGMNTPRARVAGDAEPNFAVLGIPIHGYRRSAGIRRLLQERRYAGALAEAILRSGPDVVISANTPLDAQMSALRASHDARGAFVHWCQDMYSLAVKSLLSRRSNLIARAVGARFGQLEQQIVRESDAVVLISEDFRPIVERWRPRMESVEVIDNWAPLDEITPMPRENPWSREHRMTDAPAFLYAGTLGRKHDPLLLVALAKAVPDSLVLVASEGTGTERLREIPVPANLRLLPMQPVAELSAMLSSADVLVALLQEDSQVFSVPSKVLTYLAAGRPILGAMPLSNQAARTIRDAGAGVVVEPGDRRALVAAARSLASDADLRASMGAAARRFAETTFHIGAITDRFEAVLSDAANRSHARGREQGRYS